MYMYIYAYMLCLYLGAHVGVYECEYAGGPVQNEEGNDEEADELRRVQRYQRSLYIYTLLLGLVVI